MHDDLVKSYSGTSADTDILKASWGWLEKFKKRNGICSVFSHGEAVSANPEAVEFMQEFSDCVKAEGFLPQLMFNWQNWSILEKKMPRKTYITQEEKALLAHKWMAGSFAMWKRKWGLKGQVITCVPLGKSEVL